jgi:hypothetical protein
MEVRNPMLFPVYGDNDTKESAYLRHTSEHSRDVGKRQSKRDQNALSLSPNSLKGVETVLKGYGCSFRSFPSDSGIRRNVGNG